eukprot:1192029-Prorocentrum_minimum.AAC.1
MCQVCVLVSPHAQGALRGVWGEGAFGMSGSSSSRQIVRLFSAENPNDCENVGDARSNHLFRLHV